jgi:hypothetical protein
MYAPGLVMAEVQWEHVPIGQSVISSVQAGWERFGGVCGSNGLINIENIGFMFHGVFHGWAVLVFGCF